MKKTERDIIQDTTTDLLSLLGIEATFELISKEEDEVVDIVLETEDTGIIIGYHGEVLESLQLVLSLCVAKKIGRFVRVSIEVGDYKKNRTEWLKNMVLQTKERVLEQGQEIAIPHLKSWERRIVHLLLQEDKDVVSESQGEGRDRVLVISPRQ